MNRITFKKGKSHQGMMRLAPSYEVNIDGKKVATIQELTGDFRKQPGSFWFWYGDGQNTSHKPALLEDCKREVKEHFQKKLAQAQQYDGAGDHY